MQRDSSNIYRADHPLSGYSALPSDDGRRTRRANLVDTPNGFARFACVEAEDQSDAWHLHTMGMRTKDFAYNALPEDYIEDFTACSDNLLVTFDYGYSDSLEAELSAECATNRSETGGIIYELDEGDDEDDGVGIATSDEPHTGTPRSMLHDEEIWFNAVWQKPQDHFAHEFRVHRVQHAVNQSKDSLDESYGGAIELDSRRDDYIDDSINYDGDDDCIVDELRFNAYDFGVNECSSVASEEFYDSIEA